jgi:hypothetical protein
VKLPLPGMAVNCALAGEVKSRAVHRARPSKEWSTDCDMDWATSRRETGG